MLPPVTDRLSRRRDRATSRTPSRSPAAQRVRARKRVRVRARARLCRPAGRRRRPRPLRQRVRRRRRRPYFSDMLGNTRRWCARPGAGHVQGHRRRGVLSDRAAAGTGAAGVSHIPYVRVQHVGQGDVAGGGDGTWAQIIERDLHRRRLDGRSSTYPFSQTRRIEAERRLHAVRFEQPRSDPRSTSSPVNGQHRIDEDRPRAPTRSTWCTAASRWSRQLVLRLHVAGARRAAAARKCAGLRGRSTS